ncbi:MAG: hypothetical protein IPK69_04615 [Phycisphaerales bacterium]|nr:MAG: hypothetical protein IPK69_04615 [Phycisphaerales bacterium]
MTDSPQTTRETTREPETDRLNAIMDAWDGLSGREDLERVLRDDPKIARGALELRRALATLKDPVEAPDLMGQILGAAHRARPFLTSSTRRRAVTARIMLAASVLVAAGLVMYVQNLGTPAGTPMIAIQPATEAASADMSPGDTASRAEPLRTGHRARPTRVSTGLTIGTVGRAYDPSFVIGNVRPQNMGMTRSGAFSPVFPALSSVFESVPPATSWPGDRYEPDPILVGIGGGAIDSTPQSATWRAADPWSFLHRPDVRPAIMNPSGARAKAPGR